MTPEERLTEPSDWDRIKNENNLKIWIKETCRPGKYKINGNIINHYHEFYRIIIQLISYSDFMSDEDKIIMDELPLEDSNCGEIYFVTVEKVKIINDEKVLIKIISTECGDIKSAEITAKLFMERYK